MPSIQGTVPYVLPNGALLPQDPASLPDQIGPSTFDHPLSELQTTGNALADWYRRGGIAGSLGMTPVDEQLAAAASREPAPLSARSALHPDLSNPMLWWLAPGVFGGNKSATFPHNALAQAESLERLGASRDDIHRLTGGLFRGIENEWRYPISDEPARLNPEAFRQNRYSPNLIGLKPGSTSLAAILSHPELFAAYPKMASYEVGHLSPAATAGDVRGVFYPQTQSLELAGGKPKNVLSSLLHETQHGIQDIQGFAPGGAPQFPADFAERERTLRASRRAFIQLAQEMHPELSDAELRRIEGLLHGYSFTQQTVDAINKLHPALRNELWPLTYEAGALRTQSESAYDKYRRLGGEVEARAVQEQLALGDWTTPIWQHTGYVPFSQQIVTTPVAHDPFKPPGAFTLTPVEHDPFGSNP